MKRQFSMNYDPTDKITLKYTRTADANYREYIAQKLEVLKEFSPGEVTSITEGFNATYSPEITSWLKPSFTYGSTYNSNQPLSQDYSNVGNTRSISGSLSLNPRSIFSQKKSILVFKIKLN